MSSFLQRFTRVEFAPPRYLSMPSAGVDISASAIKVAVLAEHERGLILSDYGEEPLAEGMIVGGEISNPEGVAAALEKLAKTHHFSSANITLPEARSYLFEADVAGASMNEWRTAVEQRLDEFVPLPPSEVAFDIVSLGKFGDLTHVTGVGSARRAVDQELSVFDTAGIRVHAVESETYPVPRALLLHGSDETVMIVDIGRTTTKLTVVMRRVPVFASTLEVGGNALTSAVEKHFGVSEEEAKRVKAEKGLAGGAPSDEYVAAMLSTLSVIRDEIQKRFEYWQSRAKEGTPHQPITRVILAGGNATVRGLPEYLETALKVPVELGDVFVNLASRDKWLPPIDYMESLAYATAIGLALREYVP